MNSRTFFNCKIPFFERISRKYNTIYIYIYIYIISCVVCDSSVGIATRYGLDDPGIESCRWRRDFPHPSRAALEATQCVPGHFTGGKAAGAWLWPPTPSNAEVKERVDSYSSHSCLFFVKHLGAHIVNVYKHFLLLQPPKDNLLVTANVT